MADSDDERFIVPFQMSYRASVAVLFSFLKKSRLDSFLYFSSRFVVWLHFRCGRCRQYCSAL